MPGYGARRALDDDRPERRHRPADRPDDRGFGDFGRYESPAVGSVMRGQRGFLYASARPPEEMPECELVGLQDVAGPGGVRDDDTRWIGYCSAERHMKQRNRILDAPASTLISRKISTLAAWQGETLTVNVTVSETKRSKGDRG